ncbi:MAG: nitrate reductase [Hyphomicrobiales bacterium]|nr:MAG: nitrate reductase [Hyphomicrobiales bacterium]
MRKAVLAMATGLCLSIAATSVFAAGVASLRGDLANDQASQMFDKKRVVTKEGGFKRSWELQPPSIPHKADKERINLSENTCLRCHSEEAYKKEKAPKIGDSHFLDAMGKKQTKVSARRYFCVQCHTTQVNAKPLVENVFAGQ